MDGARVSGVSGARAGLRWYLCMIQVTSQIIDFISITEWVLETSSYVNTKYYVYGNENLEYIIIIATSAVQQSRGYNFSDKL